MSCVEAYEVQLVNEFQRELDYARGEGAADESAAAGIIGGCSGCRLCAGDGARQVEVGVIEHIVKF